MRSEKNIYYIIGLALVVTIAGYFLFADSLTEWNLNLNKKKKNAYGTFITYELLKHTYKSVGFTEIKKSVIESLRKLDKNKTYNYIFINDTPYYDSATIDTLYKFAEHGNTLFICCEGLTYDFIDTILMKSYHKKIESLQSDFYYKYFLSDTIKMLDNYSRFNFYSEELKDSTGYIYYKKNKGDTLLHFFNSFQSLPDSECIHPIPDINSFSPVGYEDSKSEATNFAILKHGKGNIILVLSAIPFTNYFMRTDKGLEYAEKTLSFLPHQETLWDDVSHIYVAPERKRNQGSSEFEESPLYFILKEPTLRWAWYLTLIGILIYGIFHAKRRQNIIPLIEPKENTSLKYVETIGQLYFHEEEHIEIANEMRLQFLNYIRQKYFLKTQEIDETFYMLLSQKSAIDFEKISSIFNHFNQFIKKQSISKKELHQLNSALEYFYKHCK